MWNGSAEEELVVRVSGWLVVCQCEAIGGTERTGGEGAGHRRTIAGKVMVVVRGSMSWQRGTGHSCLTTQQHLARLVHLTGRGIAIRAQRNISTTAVLYRTERRKGDKEKRRLIIRALIKTCCVWRFDDWQASVLIANKGEGSNKGECKK